MHLSARTPRELAAYQHRVDSLRTELRLKMRTPEEIDRELRVLQYGAVTVERAVLAYVERPGTPANTKRGLRSLLDAHLRELASRPLTSFDVPACVAWLEQLAHSGLEGTTIQGYWHKLRMVFGYALERGWIGVLPWGDWTPRIHGAGRSKRAEREAARNVEELVALLRAARVIDELAGNRYEGLEAKIGVAGLLGLRQGELGGLRWPDVASERIERPGVEVDAVFEVEIVTVYVARQYDGLPLKRGCPPRVIETIPELGAMLEEHRRRLEALGLYARRGPIFPHARRSKPGEPAHFPPNGEVLRSASLRRAVERAGLPNTNAWSAHSLRDTFVTLEVAATGGDLKRVQARSRHTSLASLVRYVRSLTRNTPAPPALQTLPGLWTDDAGLLADRQPQTRTPPKQSPGGARTAAAASTGHIRPCSPHPLARTSKE